MAQALLAVKQQVGPHAVILHTRTYKRGGFFGFGARTVVEVTAADGREVGRQRRRAAEQTAARASAPSPKPHPTPSPTSTPRRDEIAAGDLIRRTYAAARAEMEKSQPPAPAPSPLTIAPLPDQQHLAQEMRAVKQMVASLVQQQHLHRSTLASTDLPQNLFAQYQALIEQEVAEELASEVIQQVRQTLTPAQLADADACRQAVLDAVSQLLPTDPDAASSKPATPGRPRIIALVGPTGVGKTTTIAKLAATFKLKQNQTVGLVTLDTYRIAAVDQLRTYAQIIGVPLHVALSPAELTEAVQQCRHCDVVLIDTAGRSQRDDPRLDDLAQFLKAVEPDEIHLVLSSTCTQAVLLDTVERFSRIQADRVIFTKLDEAVTFGVVLNVLRKVNKSLSYVTTGQEVPHQIETGQPQRLAALVLGQAMIHP